MNSIPSMDRHIQQTNDRLQCIKQVSAGAGCLPYELSIYIITWRFDTWITRRQDLCRLLLVTQVESGNYIYISVVVVKTGGNGTFWKSYSEVKLLKNLLKLKIHKVKQYSKPFHNYSACVRLSSASSITTYTSILTVSADIYFSCKKVLCPRDFC